MELEKKKLMARKNRLWVLIDTIAILVLLKLCVNAQDANINSENILYNNNTKTHGLKYGSDNIRLADNHQEFEDSIARVSAQKNWNSYYNTSTNPLSIQIYDATNQRDEIKKNSIYKFYMSLSMAGYSYLSLVNEVHNEKEYCRFEYENIMSIINNKDESPRPFVIAFSDCDASNMYTTNYDETYIKPYLNAYDTLIYISTDTLEKYEIDKLAKSAYEKGTYIYNLLQNGATVVLGSYEALNKDPLCILKYVRYISYITYDPYAHIPKCVSHGKSDFHFIFPSFVKNSFSYIKLKNPNYTLENYIKDLENSYTPDSYQTYSFPYTIFYGKSSAVANVLDPSHDSKSGSNSKRIFGVPDTLLVVGFISCSTALTAGGFAYNYYKKPNNPMKMSTVNVNDIQIPGSSYELAGSQRWGKSGLNPELYSVRSGHHNPL